MKQNNLYLKSRPLQQYLPFTVLKPVPLPFYNYKLFVATVLTVYGIETDNVALDMYRYHGCNSTYRLRY